MSAGTCNWSVQSILDPRLPQPPDYPRVPREVAAAVKDLARSRIVCPEDETGFIDAAIIDLLLPFAEESFGEDSSVADPAGQNSEARAAP